MKTFFLLCFARRALEVLELLEDVPRSIRRVGSVCVQRCGGSGRVLPSNGSTTSLEEGSQVSTGVGLEHSSGRGPSFFKELLQVSASSLKDTFQVRALSCGEVASSGDVPALDALLLLE